MLTYSSYFRAYIYSNVVTPRSIQLFILTDGGVSNLTECTETARIHSNKARCFTFGIGDNVSAELVKSLARKSNGKAEIIADHQDLQRIIPLQVKRALQPALTNIQLEWSDPEVNERQAPHNLPPIFSGERYLVYAMMDKPKENLVANLKATTPEGNKMRTIF